MNSRPGFGLLEVVLSTAIFIVVVGSLVALSRLSIRNAALAAHRAQAVNLAQDGLETVRQMRDTAWYLRGTAQSRGDETTDWLTYPDCNDGNNVFEPVTIGSQYVTCYNQTLGQFGLRQPPNTVKDLTIKDTASIDNYPVNPDGTADPGSPPTFKRVIAFEAVQSTNANTCTGANVLYEGLQLLGPDQFGSICTITGIEPIHFVRVTSTVSWRDFDKDWSVALTTMLTNWRSK